VNPPVRADNGGVDGLDALPGIARDAIRARLEGRAARPADVSGELARAAPVFVTVYKEGELRGCMGGLQATCADLVAETRERAITAAFKDPRFPPLRLEELDRCAIEVTILGALEPVASEAELDPARYGIEITDPAGRRGVLLPDLEGIDTVADQISLTRRKAGISKAASVSIRRFEATRCSPPGAQ